MVFRLRSRSVSAGIYSNPAKPVQDVNQLYFNHLPLAIGRASDPGIECSRRPTPDARRAALGRPARQFSQGQLMYGPIDARNPFRRVAEGLRIAGDQVFDRAHTRGNA